MVGLRRSGNHAIINWISRMLLPLVHINDIPFTQITDDNIYKFQSANGMIHGSVDNKWIPFNKSSNLLISVENTSPYDVETQLKKIQQHCVKLIVLIRDPWNNMASRYHIHQNVEWVQKGVDMWYSFATFNDTNVLLFNAWVSDLSYRKVVAKSLFGIDENSYTDDNCRQIKGWSRSFWDPQVTDATQLLNKLENRYRMFLQEPHFRRIVINNSKLYELWKIVCHSVGNNWKFNQQIINLN